jgi:hypothetical protein
MTRGMSQLGRVVMGFCYRHDAAIYLENIHKSGEQRCFPLAIIQQLILVIEPNCQLVGILYNIGCSMDKFINLLCVILIHSLADKNLIICL